MTPPTRPLRVLTPPRGLGGARVTDLWHSRELLAFLALRDVKVRYQQTAVGWTWAVLQPVLMMGIFSVFFGHLIGVPSDHLPYAVFVLCGTVPWALFANAISTGSESLTRNTALVSKVSFPRLVLPVAAPLSWVPDLMIGTVILVVLALLYGIVPGWTLVLLPVFFVLALLVSTAVAIWTSALNVAYRDVRFAIPFLLQLWLFVTPVVYPSSLVSHRWRWVLGLNPMASVVEGFRWTLVGAHHPAWLMMAASLVVVSLVLVTGILYFWRVQQLFADLI